jgi:DNA topoisomerase-2
MYAGSVVEEDHSGIINYQYQTKRIVPALIKCVEEIIQNSIDEWIRTEGKHANQIVVSIISDIEGTSITVSDNGRGIPVKKIGDVYQPVLAWTSLRAGSNFDDDKGRVTAGSHGMGSAIVAVLSTAFVGVTDDGINRCTVTAINGLASVEHSIVKSTKQGTTVTFMPDLPHFGLTEFSQDHIDVIEDTLRNLAILYTGIQFRFNKELVKAKSIKEIAKLFHEDAVGVESENVKLVFAPSGDQEEFRWLSYVNGINTKNGGTHVDYAMGKVIDTLRVAIKKKHKLEVLPNQIRQHILFASWVSGLKNPKFDAQTKGRITNPVGEVSSIFDGIEFEKVAKKILDTPEIIDPIIAAQLRKKEALEAAELAKKNKELDKTNLRKIPNFTDASEQTRRMDCMLMLCEGISANSSVLSARTPLIGSYPLRGKPLNVMGATTKEMLANAEFSDLLKITGLKIGTKVTRPEDLRFGKLVWVTDADMDGFAISGLLCAMIRKFWPELFDMGMVYRFRTPIMKVIVGKTELFFDSMSDFDVWAAKEKRTYKTRYLKGLGSSTAEDFRKYFSEIEGRLEKFVVSSKDDLEMLDMIYTKESGASDR